MKQFFARAFFARLEWLVVVRKLLLEKEPEGPLNDVRIGFIRPALDQLRSFCHDLNLNAAVNEIDHLQQEIRLSANLMTNQRVVDGLNGVFRQIDQGLGDGAFLFLNSDEAPKHSAVVPEKLQKVQVPVPPLPWEPEPLPAGVAEAFPSAVGDIRTARDCYATANYTACVFHLMRAAELGLRALASDRRIAIPKNVPIELATWDEIIRQIEKAEDEIQGFKKTLAREAQFAFYHGAMMEFRAFKNVFRNRVMHTRDPFDEPQARSLLTHVEAFFRILGTRISEGKRTPRQWKGRKWVT